MTTISNDALIVPIGPSASGKSTIMSTVFGDGALVSSDECRRLICGDATRQDINQQTFALFHQLIGSRLKLGVLTVADATNLTSRARVKLYELARQHNRPIVNILLDPGSKNTLVLNNRERERQVPDHVLERHWEQFRILDTNKAELLKGQVLSWEFPYAVMDTIKLAPNLEIQEADSWWVIGDIHGCWEEFHALMGMIPKEDKIAFVGDFVDRGPDSVSVLNEVSNMIRLGRAVAVMGNHDWKAYRAKVLGRKVKHSNSTQRTFDEISEADIDFVGQLPYQVHITVPTMDLVVSVVHGALKYTDRGKQGIKAVEALALYGETDGTTNAEGYPTRLYDWTKTWDDVLDRKCIFGHTPVGPPTWYGNCLNVDTGCAFGGSLTAYNPFTDKTITVPAFKTYHER